MAFFSNDAINRVHLHVGIRTLAEGAGGIFVVVFLVRAGVSIPFALLAQAAIVGSRFALRPFLFPFARRRGLKPLLLAGSMMLACQFPVLPFVHGLGAALVLYCVIAAVAQVTYWTLFNANYSILGDIEHRGSQISARDSMAALIAILAPLVGASALVSFGAGTAFGLVAAIQLVGVLPLLTIPNHRISATPTGSFRASIPGIVFSSLDGWMDTYFITFWQITLFVALRESFASYGGAMALAGLAGGACALVLGHHIDRGHGRRAVFVAYGVLVLVIVARSASLGSPALASSANAAGALAMILISPVIGAISNLAKTSPCPFRFHIATEAGWDLGCLAACLVTAALVWLGMPFASILLLALPGAIAEAIVLWLLHAPSSLRQRFVSRP